jgi:hypothetical protein
MKVLLRRLSYLKVTLRLRREVPINDFQYVIETHVGLQLRSTRWDKRNVLLKHVLGRRWMR